MRANLIWQWILAGLGLLLVVVLGLELDAKKLVSQRQFYWLAGIGIALFLMAFAATLSGELYRSRVRWLEEVCRRVAKGDFRPVESDPHNDEIAALGRALSETSARLRETIASLSAGQSRTAAIIESMAEGVAVIGADERVVYSNAAFAQILDLGSSDKGATEHASLEFSRGAGSGQISGRGLKLFELVRQSELLTLVKQALSERKRLEAEVTVGTMRPRTFAVTAAPVETIINPLGNTEEQSAESIGAVLVLHDISELRRLERVRRDFVANVSHEFKTPLTAIRGFAETLLGGALDDVEHRARFVEIICEHAARLTRLTDDLLKLSTIEAGQLALDLRSTDAVELLNAYVETARFSAAKKRHIISVRCASKILLVRADAARLRDVLQNLTDNAIQYTPEGGRITVSAEAGNGEVVFTVADNGIGIPQSDQERIFERFYRVDEARSREVGGTGLGLAIAKHIVEAHGGRIWVESKVGEGSNFHFSVSAAR